jgi:Flp pilus assembly protein TadD
MSYQPSEDQLDQVADPGSFLRNASSPSSQARTASPANQAGPDAAGAVPFFPLPAVEGAVIDHLDGWEQFAALAIRIDPPADDTSNTDLRNVLIACLESLALQFGAVWFTWRNGLYGCAVPATDMDAAPMLANGIQAQLAGSRVETVSIGISIFPQFNYDAAAALQNACKALNHAALLGTNSIVTLDSVSLNISADHYYQNGDLAAAVSEYRSALCLDAANVNVHNSLGVCLAQQGNPAEARACFEEACRIDPQEAMAVYNIGVLHLMEKDKVKALEMFRQAFAMDNRTFEIPFYIAKLLMEKKAYAEALTFLQTATALHDTCAPVHSLTGRCLACTGRSEEAVAAYRRAIKINPNDAAALSALGTIYDAKGENPDISITFCRQSVEVSPDNGLYRLRLARLYHKHNQLEEALTEYETASALGCDARRQIAEIQELLDSSSMRRALKASSR